MDSIRSLIAIAGRRLALQRWIDALSIGLLAAAATGVLGVVLVKVLPGEGDRSAAVLVAIVVSAAIGA
ncbi:MAG: hypothetical protein RIS86_2180, partial [Planctomycetota bacterium]